VPGIELERIVQFLDDVLDVGSFPDYGNALNGLQVGGPTRVSTVAAAVDATEATIREAVEAGADLLVVHHGLFWGGLRPVTGPLFRKLSALIEGRLAVYSAHLPLDAHPDLGNCAILAREIGVEIKGPCAAYKGAEIGWWGSVDLAREALRERLASTLGGDVRVIPGGPEHVRRVAVVTGGGGSFLEEVANQDLDALVTGEASHHSYHDAMELGVNLYLGGHYATETWGVRALAGRLADEFGVAWSFIDLPTGL
jgi:dinuclear metal center YbgI/SA1388 family protein